MKKHVLVVDDEIGSRESLKAVFSDRYAVSTVEDAAQALDLLSKDRFDLVLMDVIMPNKDGVTLLKEVQGLYPSLPVIMVSASTSVRPVVGPSPATSTGMSDYLPMRPTRTAHAWFRRSIPARLFPLSPSPKTGGIHEPSVYQSPMPGRGERGKNRRGSSTGVSGSRYPGLLSSSVRQPLHQRSMQLPRGGLCGRRHGGVRDPRRTF